MALVDMTLSKEEAKEESGLMSADYDMPRYPYGLCLCLDDDSLKKLGITSLPAIGTEMMITAKVKVTSVRSRETQTENQSDSESSVDMQITAMEIGANQEARSAATVLYGGAGGSDDN